GFSANAGWSGYQHKNRSTFLQGLMNARNFTYPSGNSGPDGQAYNLDLAFGAPFADGKGHAMAYATWRKNDELRQGARDYSSCALNAGATACGGSATSPNPSFLPDYFVVDAQGNPIINHRADGTPIGQFLVSGQARLNADGTWARGLPPAYNYAPINHYQRPDERWTLGGSLKYEVNPYFRPFVETMVANTNTSVQIAESGTFFVHALDLPCDSPLLGSFCTDLRSHGNVTVRDSTGTQVTVPAFLDPAQGVTMYVGKRNVEGGPRIAQLESTSFRVVTGAEGDLVGDWSYKFSFLYGRNSSNEANINDFISSRVKDAMLGCPAGSFSGCVPYNVFQPNGVTPAQAAGLSGTGMRQGSTTLQAVNAYATGSLPFSVVQDAPVSTVVGFEHRKEGYRVDTDANMASGNFTGLGGPRRPIKGEISVSELFTEVQMPLVRNMGMLKSVDADLGYRASDYSTSGRINTYKVGANASLGDFRLRAGYNRAIRAPQTGELFADQQISLWGGADPCAGAAPALTEAQCARTGVQPGQYGNITTSPASQYNQFSGGNPNLNPEKGDTWTVGLVVTPMRGLSVTADYFDIKIADRIGTIGAENIVRFCATTGDPFLCSKIRRNPSTGDIWRGSSLQTSGYVTNLSANIGELRTRGIDLAVSYAMPLMGGRLSTSFSGTALLEQFVSPLAGINDAAAYDCKGKINTSCQAPEWKHTMSARYSKDWWSVNLRWRHTAAMKYISTTGVALTTDQLLVRNGGKLSAWNYLDLSGSVDFSENISMTFGVNNVADKSPPMVGSTLSLNGTSIGGYDQLGRYLFANLNFRY
ncbi:MAG: TonB-dependent receptor domain-containing protein, partial [Inhella sp.]